MSDLIHPSAFISKGAFIGHNVSIGPFSIIHDNVVINDDTKIGAYCELGVQNEFTNSQTLVIGKKSTIRSHSIFYEGSTFGEGLTTGHRVTVREKTIAGQNLQIGTLCDIQGDCTIGDYVRFHSNVHIGKKSIIGNFVWIFPYVVLTNDPHPPSEVLIGVSVHDYAVIATMSIILPGAVISEGVLVGAHSSLKGETRENWVYAGNPAKPICPTHIIKLKDGSNRNAYPWTEHFHRGYPEEQVIKWSSPKTD